MSINSQSTDEEVAAAYDDNADYRHAVSAEKAALYAQACRILIRRTPSMFSQDGQAGSFPVYIYENQLKEAEQFLEQLRYGGSRNRYYDLRDCRE